MGDRGQGADGVHSPSLFGVEAQALVNPVNCVGVMGRGVALEFKRRYPTNYDAYLIHCRLGHMRPGEVFTHRVGVACNPSHVINFPTKRHWRDVSRLDDVDAGLESMIADILAHGFTSVASPALGCGLGGLNWKRDVRPLMIDRLDGLVGVSVTVFGPGDPKDASLEVLRLGRGVDLPDHRRRSVIGQRQRPSDLGR